MTDLAGRVAERYVLTPYGEVTVHQETGYGDLDGDADVDSTDKGTVGVTCTGTVGGACRILDFDGDYDSTDATKFDALPSGLRRSPGRGLSGLAQVFAHQGLPLDGEVGSYQNRARHYQSVLRRFIQRDAMLFDSDLIAENNYVDGLSLYIYLISSPVGSVDPTGYCCTLVGPCNAPNPNPARCKTPPPGTPAFTTVTFGICNCGFCCWGVQGCSKSWTCAFFAVGGWLWSQTGSATTSPCL